MSLKPATKNYITKRITEAECLEAALWLKDGHIVAFPTETVYGLGACAFNDQAIKRIFTAKNRPQDNPLIVHITDDAQLKRVTMSIPKSFYRLRDLFWPGPLTCILQGHPDLPRCVSAGLNTVAVRMPAHPTAQKLINLVGEPLVAPSANLSGKPSATTADHVLEDFSGKIPFIIDGGQCSLGIESTVISLIEDKPYLLRPGSITIQALEHALGRQVHLPHKENKNYVSWNGPSSLCTGSSCSSCFFRARKASAFSYSKKAPDSFKRSCKRRKNAFSLFFL